MPKLREALTARGYADVPPHVRSGNVVLASDLPEHRLTAELTTAIAEDFGMEGPVVLRTGKELAAILAHDPLGSLVTDPSRYSVTFLPERPERKLVTALPPPEDGEY